MCREHWQLVPRRLRDRIYDTLNDWRGGHSPVQYLNAVRDAIAAVERLEAKRRGPQLELIP